MPARPTVHQSHRRLPSLVFLLLMASALGPTTAVATEAGRHAVQGYGPGLTDRAQARESSRVARQRALTLRSKSRLERTHGRREARQRALSLRSKLRLERTDDRREEVRQRAHALPSRSSRKAAQSSRDARRRARPPDARVEARSGRASTRRLPDRTSRYNVGGVLPRVRNRDGGVDFRLGWPTTVYDGGGRRLALARGPVNLNAGAVRWMSLDGRGPEPYLFAQRTGAGVAGWVRRRALASPPPLRTDTRNPRPPSVSPNPLVIDAAQGRSRLTGLRFVNSHGVFPEGGGNRGEHYAGRNPGPLDYIYLLFAVPNVRYGGVANDSLPDGSRFISALGDYGRPILETMTMYRGRDFASPVKVIFLYGRAPRSRRYGWLARANVGPL